MTVKKSVHQVIVGASKRDAITNMSLTLRDVLREKYNSHIYAFLGPDETVLGEIQHIDDFPRGTTDDLILYHSSFGWPKLTDWLLGRQEKLGLVYHNITPSVYYRDEDPEFAAGLEWGRQELTKLRQKIVLACADSKFNCEDLNQYGYEGIVEIPAGFDPYRLAHISLDATFLGELHQYFPDGYILGVSQVLPHKRIELLLELVHLLRSVHRLKVGLVVAGPIRKSWYMRDLNAMRNRLPEAHVLFTDEISESQLATLYESCLVYVGTSEHEGLAVPPIEAMALGAPVVIRGCGAVPETVADSALVVDRDAGIIELTEVVLTVIQNKRLRAELVRRGFQRAKYFHSLNPTQEFMSLIDSVMM